MKTVLQCLFICCLLVSCKSKEKTKVVEDVPGHDLIIAFGSCNRQDVANKLWDDVLAQKPQIWIWGGDNIYSDTDDMALMAQHYAEQLAQPGYSDIRSQMQVHGTWDDHDYGLNDGGFEFSAKAGSQQLLLDFLEVPVDHVRRQREGVYYSEVVNTEKGSVKIIVLDTRYFRTALTPSDDPDKRYRPNPEGEGTILGEVQWKWLEQELKSSVSDFNLIVTSIQLLSREHGYESWGNMPHEASRMLQLIRESKAKGVVVLSGDRHISEFSKTTVEGMDYPVIDFTSSGLTHSYSSFSGEPNSYRIGEVVSDLSFGLLSFDFTDKKVTMQMRGDQNTLQQEIIQAY